MEGVHGEGQGPNKQEGGDENWDPLEARDVGWNPLEVEDVGWDPLAADDEDGGVLEAGLDSTGPPTEVQGQASAGPLTEEQGLDLAVGLGWASD